jgi:energy-coupling factor transporter transmembrane protein EcfT
MKIHPTGLTVFLALCVLLAIALTNPAWMQIASIVATVFIALSVGGIFLPRAIRKRRGM